MADSVYAGVYHTEYMTIRLNEDGSLTTWGAEQRTGNANYFNASHADFIETRRVFIVDKSTAFALHADGSVSCITAGSSAISGTTGLISSPAMDWMTSNNTPNQNRYVPAAWTSPLSGKTFSADDMKVKNIYVGLGSHNFLMHTEGGAAITRGPEDASGVETFVSCGGGQAWVGLKKTAGADTWEVVPQSNVPNTTTCGYGYRAVLSTEITGRKGGSTYGRGRFYQAGSNTLERPLSELKNITCWASTGHHTLFGTTAGILRVSNKGSDRTGTALGVWSETTNQFFTETANKHVTKIVGEGTYNDIAMALTNEGNAVWCFDNRTDHFKTVAGQAGASAASYKSSEAFSGASGKVVDIGMTQGDWSNGSLKMILVTQDEGGNGYKKCYTWKSTGASTTDLYSSDTSTAATMPLVGNATADISSFKTSRTGILFLMSDKSLRGFGSLFNNLTYTDYANGKPFEAIYAMDEGFVAETEGKTEGGVWHHGFGYTFGQNRYTSSGTAYVQNNNGVSTIVNAGSGNNSYDSDYYKAYVHGRGVTVVRTDTGDIKQYAVGTSPQSSTHTFAFHSSHLVDSAGNGALDYGTTAPTLMYTQQRQDYTANTYDLSFHTQQNNLHDDSWYGGVSVGGGAPAGPSTTAIYFKQTAADGAATVAPYFEFYTDDAYTTPLTELTAGTTYTFNYKADDTGHPFWIGDSTHKSDPPTGVTLSNAPAGRSKDGGIVPGESLDVALAADFAGALHYFCTTHAAMISQFGTGLILSQNTGNGKFRRRKADLKSLVSKSTFAASTRFTAAQIFGLKSDGSSRIPAGKSGSTFSLAAIFNQGAGSADRYDARVAARAAPKTFGADVYAPLVEVGDAVSFSTSGDEMIEIAIKSSQNSTLDQVNLTTVYEWFVMESSASNAAIAKQADGTTNNSGTVNLAGEGTEALEITIGSTKYKFILGGVTTDGTESTATSSGGASGDPFIRPMLA